MNLRHETENLNITFARLNKAQKVLLVNLLRFAALMHLESKLDVERLISEDIINNA